MNRRAVRLFVVLGVLIVVLVAADRIASVFAGKTAARYLDKRADFATTPTVDIRGFPFATQAVRGDYRDVEIKSGAVRLGRVSASSLDVHLRGAHLPLSDAFGGTIHQLSVDTVTGTLTISYAQLVRLSTIPELSLSESHGRLTASATLPVPGSSVTASVSGIATTVVTGDTVVLHVSDVSVDGLTVPPSAVSQLAAMLATPIPIPALPFGLVLDSVKATADGVVVTGSGRQVVISATG